MTPEILAAIIGAVIGGFLSAGAGIAAALYIRRRSALDLFIEEVTRAVYLPLDENFQWESARKLQDSVIRLRPYLSERCFSRCLAIVSEYRGHRPAGLNPHSLEYDIHCKLEDIDERSWALDFTQRLIATASESPIDRLPQVI